jgi:hypothetical protein
LLKSSAAGALEASVSPDGREIAYGPERRPLAARIGARSLLAFPANYVRLFDKNQRPLALLTCVAST